MESPIPHLSGVRMKPESSIHLAYVGLLLAHTECNSCALETRWAKAEGGRG